jgi:hypothetical protein
LLHWLLLLRWRRRRCKLLRHGLLLRRRSELLRWRRRELLYCWLNMLLLQGGAGAGS